jgi:hypothetical protein
MEKLIEFWEKALSYFLEFWEIITRYTSQAWEAISPFLKSIWGKFLSEYCQFGAVCSDGNLTWMGGAVIAVIAVSIIVLIFAVLILVRNS